MNLKEQVKNTIISHSLISAGDFVLLGFSGGPDSLSLLYILSELQAELDFKLYALHVNHLLRGKDSDDDAAFAKEICLKLSVPLRTVRLHVKEEAEKEGLSIEAAARKLRHRELARTASEMKRIGGKEVLVALAHNSDDQAETVLMRIIRGTGVHGLAAMDYKREDGFIRPLLDCSRKDVEEYIIENRLSPRMDLSNLDTKYTRNRLRLRLIPEIEKDFNRNVKESLARLADSAREDDRFINSVVREEILKSDGGSIPLEHFISMDPAVSKRVIKLMFACVGLKEDIGAVHINRLLQVLTEKPESPLTIEFPKGFYAKVAYGKVSFKAPAPGPEEYSLEYRLLLPGEFPDYKSLGGFSCLLDANKLAEFEDDLVLRTRKQGDIIRPTGMQGSKKIQDYMVDAKILKEERDSVLLLCVGREVLWVQNGPVSRLAAITKSTRIGILIDIKGIRENKQEE